MKQLIINAKPLMGTIQVPGDKSISHRSIMLGALAEGSTKITNFLRADDCLDTMSAFKQMGVTIDDEGDQITVHGVGLKGLKAPQEALDLGNSGTTMRLLIGLLAGQQMSVTLTGDASLSTRPMNRVTLPIRSMQGQVRGVANIEHAPISIEPAEKLVGITYEMPVASAQVKSAILLAGLQAEGTTTVIEKVQSRTHTEDMLQQFGVAMHIKNGVIQLEGGQTLQGQPTLRVPGDISSAAFFLAAGALVKDSQLRLNNVGLNHSRTGLIDVLEQMGANMRYENVETGISADIMIQQGTLQATTVEGPIIPRLIDELPVIALLATQAEGRTVIKDAEELRVKETDRITAVVNELKKMGADITATEDGMIINGPTPLHGAQVDSYGDHRIGMMLQIAALIVEEGEVLLEKSNCVSISYPNFFQEVARLAGKSL